MLTHPLLEAYGKWITFWMDKVSGAVEGTAEHFVESVLSAFPAPDPQKFGRNPDAYIKDLRFKLAKVMVKRSPMQRTNFYTKFEKSAKQLLDLVTKLTSNVRSAAMPAEKWRDEKGYTKFILTASTQEVVVLERGKEKTYKSRDVKAWEKVASAPSVKGTWTKQYLIPMISRLGKPGTSCKDLLRTAKDLSLNHLAEVLASLSDDDLTTIFG